MKKLLALLLISAMVATTFTAASCSTIIVQDEEDDNKDKDEKDKATDKSSDESEPASESVSESDDLDGLSQADETDPAKFFNDAIEKTKSLKYLIQTTVADTDVTMTANGESFSFSMPQTAITKLDQSDPDAIVLYYCQTIDQSELGSGTTTVETFMDSEWAYVSQHTAGENVAFKYRINEVDEIYSETQNALDMVKPLPEEYFEDYELVPNADGSYTVDVEIDLDDFSEIFDETMETVAESNGVSISSREISNTKASITVKDGYVVSYLVAFDMSMQVEGVDAVYSFSIDISYTDIGKEFTLTPPEGFEDFPDYTEALQAQG